MAVLVLAIHVCALGDLLKMWDARHEAGMTRQKPDGVASYSAQLCM